MSTRLEKLLNNALKQIKTLQGILNPAHLYALPQNT